MLRCAYLQNPRSLTYQYYNDMLKNEKKPNYSNKQVRVMDPFKFPVEPQPRPIELPIPLFLCERCSRSSQKVKDQRDQLVELKRFILMKSYF